VAPTASFPYSLRCSYFSYTTLSDPEKRHQYDHGGRPSFGSSGGGGGAGAGRGGRGFSFHTAEVIHACLLFLRVLNSELSHHRTCSKISSGEETPLPKWAWAWVATLLQMSSSRRQVQEALLVEAGGALVEAGVALVEGALGVEAEVEALGVEAEAEVEVGSHRSVAVRVWAAAPATCNRSAPQAAPPWEAGAELARFVKDHTHEQHTYTGACFALML
jgi:hypothetical protein